MSEGVPLDIDELKHRTKIEHLMREVAMVEKGLLPACNNKDCERAGVLLLNGIWCCENKDHRP